MQNKNMIELQDPQCNKTDVMERCITCFKNILMEYEPNGNPNEWMDSLDFVEIIMEVEKEFDIKIDEGFLQYWDFRTLDGMAKWLLSFNVA